MSQYPGAQPPGGPWYPPPTDPYAPPPTDPYAPPPNDPYYGTPPADPYGQGQYQPWQQPPPGYQQPYPPGYWQQPPPPPPPPSRVAIGRRRSRHRRHLPRPAGGLVPLPRPGGLRPRSGLAAHRGGARCPDGHRSLHPAPRALTGRVVSRDAGPMADPHRPRAHRAGVPRCLGARVGACREAIAGCGAVVSAGIPGLPPA